MYVIYLILAESESGNDSFLEKISLSDLPEEERKAFMEGHEKWLTETLSEQLIVAVIDQLMYRYRSLLKKVDL